MVDNIAVSAGTGTSIAADDVGGNLHQRVKVTWGPDGTGNDTDTATGKPLPVQLRSPTGTDLTGAAGTASAAVVTVQGVASMTPLANNQTQINGVTVSTGSGVSGTGVQRVTLATDDIVASAIKAEDSASADGDKGIVVHYKRSDTPGSSSGTDLDYEPAQVSGGMQWTWAMSKFATVSTDITRPADTTAYAVADTFSDSTSAPTTFTFTSAARKSGGSGLITDAVIISSNPAGTPLQGEIWIFDSSVTSANDNAAFALSDADAKLLVGKIAFTLATDATNNSQITVPSLNIGFTCVGSANLRFLVKVKNAYTPISAEVLTVRLKIIYLD
jgi:hypothetical protein